MPCLQSSGRAEASSGIVWLTLMGALEDLGMSLHLMSQATQCIWRSGHCIG